uniref:Uncharacterized protein LOC111114239 n=1 Tax=Crassostrea virginica TaxID=6565 RepID=A0A8B8BZG6_CRAVI|nr:uncharacterized protein LOC111114239 [Crassostrea virginica]
MDMFEDLERENEVLRKDFEELENLIFSKYQESAVIIKTQKTYQRKHSQKLIAELNKQGEALHRDINRLIQRKQFEIDHMNAKQLAALEKQEDSSEDELSPPAKPLLDVPRLIADIPSSEYDYPYNVACLSAAKKWTRCNNEIMKLYNLKGEVLGSVQSKSGNMAEDIAVTQSGGLVYTYNQESSINLYIPLFALNMTRLRSWPSNWITTFEVIKLFAHHNPFIHNDLSYSQELSKRSK